MERVKILQRRKPVLVGKKQYEAIWFAIDGNRHSLYPLYANTAKEARMQVEDFIDYSKKRKFTNMESIIVKES